MTYVTTTDMKKRLHAFVTSLNSVEVHRKVRIPVHLNHLHQLSAMDRRTSSKVSWLVVDMPVQV